MLSTLRALLSGTFLHTLPTRTGYATEAALFIFTQLAADAVSALKKCLGTIKTVEANVNTRHIRPGLKKKKKKKKSFLSIQTILVLFVKVKCQKR